MKEDENTFISENPTVACKATLAFSSTNKPTLNLPVQNIFLVGTVAGCNLRLAGTDLPSLIFQISNFKTHDLTVRSLSPISGLTLNGSTFREAILRTGDRLNIGKYEFVLNFEQLQETEKANTYLLHNENLISSSVTKKKKTVLPKGLRKKHLSWLVRKLKKRHLTFKTKFIDLQVKEQILSNREQELLSKELNLQSEKVLIEQQVELLCNKNKRDSEELDLLKNELTEQRASLEKERVSISNYESSRDSDLATLARMQDMLDRKFQNLKERAKEVDRKGEELEKTSRELEEQATQIDAIHHKLQADRLIYEEQNQTRKLGQEETFKKIAEVDQQMVEVFHLKIYLEKIKLRCIEKEINLEKHLSQIQNMEDSILAKNNELLKKETDLAITLINLNQKKEELEHQKIYADVFLAQIEQKEVSLLVRESSYNQIEIELRDKLQAIETEKISIENFKNTQEYKEKQSGPLEKNLAQMQEILRKRLEEITVKEALLNEKESLVSNQIISLQARNEEMETDHAELIKHLTSARNEFDQNNQVLQNNTAELEAQKSRIETEHRGHEAIKNEIFQALQRLEEEKDALEETQNLFLKNNNIKFIENKDLQMEITKLSDNIPELIASAENALSRLLGARDLLQEHLHEFHDYTKTAREELESLLRESRNQEDHSQNIESKITNAREEHRLSVASFRQQLIDWQHKLADIKLSLHNEESELQRKQAKFHSQSQILQHQSDKLLRKESDLREKEGEVFAQSIEVHRHLDEMKEWYRTKIKDLSGNASSQLLSGYFDHSSDKKSADFIVTKTDSVDPTDKKLGEQLVSLHLVEAETLSSLMAEAKKTRKSLRQSLLNGGYLTFYQLALIEAGNINGLMIDRFRVIDKHPSTSKENIYHVFDPVRKTECLLRHLSENEMNDPCHPDEFRQQFISASNINHENVSSTFEVLEIQGRPAVLIEFSYGISQSDWAPIFINHDAWLHLIWQSLSGLASIHGAGLIYGLIQPSSIILTKSGLIKLIGAGCPLWITSNEPQASYSVKKDLANLATETKRWFYNEANPSSLKIATDFALESYIQFITEVAAGQISTDLNEWLVKTSDLLQSREGWESSYNDFVKSCLSAHSYVSARLSA